MYTLYYGPGMASFVVHWTLLELGVPHELRRLDTAAREHKSPEYLRLNPNGLVPTLLADGQPLYEAAALVMFLVERHPQPRLAPAPGDPRRGTYLQWMLHLANTVAPTLRAWWYPDEPAGPDNTAAVRAAAEARLAGAWDRIGQQLGSPGPYMLGAELSVLDLYVTMLARWSRAMSRPALQWPALRALVTRTTARPSFRTLYEREGLTEWP